jgi:hypothetical protein
VATSGHPGQLTAIRLICGLVALAAFGVTVAAPGPSVIAPALAPRTPQVMLFISRPVGAGATAQPTFGLRVEQVRLAADSGSPDGGDPIQHRELINWQMEAHSDIRMQLGRRVTYNLSRGAFASQVRNSAIAMGVPTFRNTSPIVTTPKASGSSELRTFGFPEPRPMVARTIASNPTIRDEYREPSAVREIAAAAVAAFNSGRSHAPQRALPAGMRAASPRPSISRPN